MFVLVKKSIMKNLLLIIPLLLGLFACKAKKVLTSSEDRTQVLELTKTPCFGECPAFTMKIYSDGFAELDAQLHLSKLGILHQQLDEKTMTSLYDTCKKNDVFALNDKYMERIMDLPTTVLMFSHDGQTKRITGNYQFPQGFKNVVATLMEIVEGDGWKLVKPHNTK